MNQEVQADKKDVSFKVLDPPRTPLAPSSPDRFRLNTLVLLAALGAGLLVTFLLGQRDPAFYSTTPLNEAAGVPVYGMVSIVGHTADLQRHWRFHIAAGALFLGYIAVLLINRFFIA